MPQMNLLRALSNTGERHNLSYQIKFQHLSTKVVELLIELMTLKILPKPAGIEFHFIAKGKLKLGEIKLINFCAAFMSV